MRRPIKVASEFTASLMNIPRGKIHLIAELAIKITTEQIDFLPSLSRDAS